MKKIGFTRKGVLLLLVSIFLLAGCSLTPPAATPDNTGQLPADNPQNASGDTQVLQPALATPAADSPAAGICAQMDGEWVTVKINPDMPDPRCVIIRADQKLSVVNQRNEAITVRLGDFDYTLLPGQGQTFDRPFGEYLAPGVHLLQVDPCCGMELVFDVDL